MRAGKWLTASCCSVRCEVMPWRVHVSMRAAACRWQWHAHCTAMALRAGGVHLQCASCAARFTLLHIGKREQSTSTHRWRCRPYRRASFQQKGCCELHSKCAHAPHCVIATRSSCALCIVSLHSTPPSKIERHAPAVKRASAASAAASECALKARNNGARRSLVE